MSALADKLRRARESTIECGGHVFTIRRPTDFEAVLMGEKTALDILCQHTVGWNLTELGLGVPGGTDAAVPFDADCFREWVQDQPAAFAALMDGIKDTYAAHAQQREDAAKN